MKSILAVSVVMFATVVFAEKQPYERYQPIVDRCPFGPLPEGFDPTKSPVDAKPLASSREQKQMTQEQEKLKASIRFSVINQTPEGEIAVGFTDNGDPKAPRHYYLKVGEERDGWKVLEADPARAWMKVVKDDLDPIELEIGAASDGKAKPNANGAANSPSRRGGLVGGGALSRPGVLSGGSLAERRLRRQQAAEAEAADYARRQAEEKAAQAEREQKEAEEKALREQERAEQREQLERIKEELKRVRESKKNEAPKDESAAEGDPVEI